MDPTVPELAARLLQRCGEAGGLSAVEHLAGDASGRRYFRLRLSGGSSSTLVLSLLSHERGPVCHGGRPGTQDDTFVEVGRFLAEHGIRVPRVVVDARPDGALVMEDMGDRSLWGLTVGASASAELARNAFGAAALVAARLGECEDDGSCVAFSRCLTASEYLVEARRFVDSFLVPEGHGPGLVGRVEEGLERLCQAVAAHPRRLAHRDFQPWNLHLLDDAGVGVIDFQDALMASEVYDLVSLLHDRDVDVALGEEARRSVAALWASRTGAGADFPERYREALLQRSFRLAGQFRLLTERTGRPVYAAWVPGCLRRIGSALAASTRHGGLLGPLAAAIPQVAEGAASPLQVLPDGH